MKSILEESIRKLGKWVEEHHYRGYEPADALNSFVRPLTVGNLFMERLLIALVKQSPINLRPLIGVRHHDTTIGRGYMAGGYLILSALTGEETHREKAENCLEWLIKNKSPHYEEFAWGNHYDFAGRTGKYSKCEPIIVWTSIIGQTFLDAYELYGDEKYMRIAESVCRWILSLPREQTDSGACISYLAIRQMSIHNSNMLGAAMLARTAKLTGNAEYTRVARDAIEYSVSRQLPDGAWYYGEASNQHWIDNFHTGYNLDSLRCFMENTGDWTYEENLLRGLKFFQMHFFEESGRPRYYHSRTYPVDIQCASQAIETLAGFGASDPSSLVLACKVAKWTIDEMQDETGYFFFRQYPYRKEKTPMMHWGQGTTYKALAFLLSIVTKQN
jgi:rhamnogalacturonyl hydrolase YesR